MRNWGEIEGRIDPLYYTNHIIGLINNLNYEKVILKNLIIYAQSGFAAGKNEQSSAENKNSMIQIRPTNINSDGELVFDRNVYIENVSPNHILEKEEILFNNTNSQELVGKTAYFDLDTKFCCSNHITRIKVKDNIANPKYIKELFNFYQRKRIFFNLCTNWNNQSGINNDVLEKLILPLPSLEIQQKIVDIMDNAYEIKRQKEKQAEDLLNSIDDYLLEELGITLLEEPANTLENRISIISSKEVLGRRFDSEYHKNKFKNINKAINNCKYETEKLSNLIIGDIIKGRLPEYATNKDENKVKVIQITNMTFDASIDISNARWSKNIYLPNHLIDKGDILMAITGATIGKIGLFDYEGEYYLGGDIVKFNFNDFQYSTIVSSLLLTKPYQELISRNITGATNGHLSPDDIKRLPLPVIRDFEVKQNLHNTIFEFKNLANCLLQEAEEILSQAKKEVENILLGGKESLN